MGFVLILLPYFWLMIALSGGRLAFLLWNWTIFDHQEYFDIFLGFLWGLRFDWVTSSTLFLPLFVMSLFLGPFVHLVSIRRLFYLLVAILAIPVLAVNVADAELYHFVGRRFSADSIFLLAEGQGKVVQLVATNWLLAAMGCGILILFLTALFKEIPGQKLNALVVWASEKQPLAKKFVLALSVFLFLAIGARGGLQEKPINFAHAQVFPTAIFNAFITNSGFSFFQNLKRQKLARESFFVGEEKSWHQFLNYQQVAPVSKLGATFVNKPNIFLIVLESFSYEYMGYPFSGQGYTPFLDQLASKSLFFYNAYANGRRSIEGIGSIFGGVPALMPQPFVSSQFLNNQFFGLGTLLTDQGYDTAFFHGAKNGSMYFDSFMKAAGVTSYYGLNEFPDKNEFDGTWGIWDEPFFMWSLQKVNEMKRPFFASIFSLTSHHPFRVPEKHRNKFPLGNLDILESVGYTDFVLSEFFKKAENEDWFKDTLFIITADHTYKNLRPEMDHEPGLYRVPLIFFHPSIDLRKFADSNQVVSHIDIIPSILDFLRVNPKVVSKLGASVFSPGDRSVVHFMDGRYQMITRDHYVVREREKFLFYSANDFKRQKDLSSALPKELKDELENKMTATIQYFNEGMLDNRLYYPSRPE